MTPQAPSKWAPWDLTEFSQLPSFAPLYFLTLINSLKSLPFQRWFKFWEKPEVAECQIWAVGELSHQSDWCFAKKLCTRWDTWADKFWWWNCQSPVAHSCNLLNHPNSFCGEMFKLNAKFDAYSLLYSLSHFECDDHTVHTLTQWHLLSSLTSTVKSSFTHVHSSPLFLAARLHQCNTNLYASYINNGWVFSSR